MNNPNICWPGWEMVRLIGRGGFGAVYEIQRELVNETVEKAALKVITIPQNDSDIEEMRSDGYDDESITATYQSHLRNIVDEYSTMRKMNGSANIVNCDDVHYEAHADGIGWDVYIKMELLTPLVKCLPDSIPEEMVVKLAKDLCAALELCRRYDVIHRDIKPQNIFLSNNGDYKLGDFGIAKTVEKTMGGTKIGTYKYMAPEVYNNQPYGASADIYSLGLVLYWMLNERRLPFVPQGKASVGAEEEARHRRFSGEQIPEPKNGSKELKGIVLKACAFNPKDRYSTAAQMLEALRTLDNKANTTVAAGHAGNFSMSLDDATVGPVFHETADQTETVGPVWNNSEKNRKSEEDRTVGPDFSVAERVQMKPDAKVKKNLVCIIAAIGAAVLILALLLRSCFGGSDKPVEAGPNELPTVVTEETEAQTDPTVAEPEEEEKQTEPHTEPEPTEKATEADRDEQSLETASGKKLSKIKYACGEYSNGTISYGYGLNGKIHKIDFSSEYASDMVFEYDDDGRFIKMESDSSGDTYNYDYSSLSFARHGDRVMALSWGNSDEGAAQWNFYYDEDGKIELISSGDDDIECEYDSVGRLIKATKCYPGDGCITLIQEYEYDAEGRLSRIIETEPFDEGEDRIAETVYFYDYAPLVISTRTWEYDYYTTVYFDFGIFDDVATAVPLLMANHAGSSYWEGSFFFSYDDLDRVESDENGNLSCIEAEIYSENVRYDFTYSE